jgi:hypothetical protein
MIKTRKSDKRGYGMAHACGLMADVDDFDAGGCGGGDNDNPHYHFKCHNF